MSYSTNTFNKDVRHKLFCLYITPRITLTQFEGQFYIATKKDNAHIKKNVIFRNLLLQESKCCITLIEANAARSQTLSAGLANIIKVITLCSVPAESEMLKTGTLDSLQ